MSNYKLSYTREAANEVKEATEWYNEKQKGLGKRFRADILKVIEKIEENPFFASVNYADIRTAACKTFPYSVHYSINKPNKTISIISIFHFSRKPKSLE